MGASPEIVIISYRPEWSAEFDEIACRLKETLGAQALRIDHIGSTSVPGLAAKDIIDLQVTVADFTTELEPLFNQAGYLRRADIDRDHRPPTATGPDQDWEKRYYREPPGGRVRHIHVRRARSANGRYALLFRDYLRAHSLAAAAYAQAKMALAHHAPDNWDQYYDVKDPVCDIIMAGAEDWARTIGWRVEHY